MRKPDVYENNPYASLFDLNRAREILGFEGGRDRPAIGR